MKMTSLLHKVGLRTELTSRITLLMVVMDGSGSRLLCALSPRDLAGWDLLSTSVVLQQNKVDPAEEE